MRVLPVGGAVLSATPNPIRLGPGAGQAVTASVNASNPTYNWTAGANLNLSSTSGATVCASATSSATGSSTLTVAAPGTGAAGVTIPVTFVALGDTSGLQARVNMSPSGGALNLNAGVAFTATPANVCGTYPITWSVTRRNSSGIEVTPAGTINGGVYMPPSPQLADGELITVRAQLTGTNVFNTVGVVQSSAANSLTLTPNPLTIMAGDSPTQFYATISTTGLPTGIPVNWGVQPGGYGVSITNLGVLYPPSFIDVPRDFVVRVSESAYPNRIGTATVRVNGGCIPTLGLAASPTQLAPGDSTTLTVTNTCSGNPNYTYEFTPSIGTWNPGTRQYTIPSNASAGIVSVRATLLDNQNAPSSFSATTSFTIALLPAVSINPAGPVNLFPGQSQALTATVANASNTGVSWSITPAAPAGSTSSGNTYTFVGSVVAADQTHTLTATSLQDNSRTRTVSITQKAITVNITNGPASVNSAQTATYTANTNFGGVTWSVSPTTYASINSTSGLLTAGTGFNSAQSVTVRATSTVDATKSATFGVTLNPTIAVTNIRPTLIYRKDANTQMLADVTGTTNTGLNWTMAQNANFGSVTTSGSYGAPVWVADNSNITMTATSQADPTKSATQTVVIRQGIGADSVSPASGSGETQTFTSTFTLRDTSSTINQVYMNIGADLSSTLCTVSYNRTNGNFYLWNGSNALLVPAGGSQSSSQCTLFATGSSATYSNNVLTANFRITFNTNWGGAKQVYLLAEGNGGTWTGGQILKGSWTVPAPPITISISPATQVTLQGGQSQTYTATASSGGIVWSKNTGLGTLSSTSGTSTTFTAPGSISTNQYMTIRATSSLDANRWAEATIYLSNVPPPPLVTSITPINGSGADPAFVLQASNPSGGQNVSSAAISLAFNSASVNGPGSCSVTVYRGGNPDEWGAGISAYPPYYEYQNNWVGQFNSNTLINDTCRAYGIEMSVGWSGNSFTASIPLHLKPEVSGTYGVYGLVSGGNWQYFGTWTK